MCARQEWGINLCAATIDNYSMGCLYRHMAIDTVAIYRRADLRSHFTKVMVGFAMAARTVLRVALHCFNSVVVHAVAGGAFYFAVKKTLAAAKQFDLVAMNIYPRRIPVRVKRLATVEIGQGITGFKIKDGLRHDLCITPVALRTKVDSLLP